MYLAFLKRWEFDIKIVDDQVTEKPRTDQISLLVSGPGAAFLLQQEHGVHVMRQTRQDQSQREGAKVEILSLDTTPAEPFVNQCQVKTRTLKNTSGRLSKKLTQASLFHPPTQVALNIVTEVPPDEVAPLLAPWLAAMVHRHQQAVASGTQTATDAVVRRYELGPNALIRDTATGLRWGQPDRLFSGWLDRFVCLPTQVRSEQST
jgi:hypothetical protein